MSSNSEPKAEEVIIARDGTVRAIYSPLTADMAQHLGDAEIRRASHVEPGAELSQAVLSRLFGQGSDYVEQTGDPPVFSLRANAKLKWWADMTPVNGPVLGPYDTRDEALDDERVWLLEHHTPFAP